MSQTIAAEERCRGQIAAYRAMAAAKHKLQTSQTPEIPDEPKVDAQKSETKQENLTETKEKREGCDEPSLGGWYIYILRCANEKFYVGKSKNVQRRFLQHVRLGSQRVSPDEGISEEDESLAGASAAWTRLHEPLEIVRSFPMRTPHDEETTTIDLMIENGMDNVRGGPFCAVDLPRHQVLVIRQRIASIKELCFVCMRPGHFASSCPERPQRLIGGGRTRAREDEDDGFVVDDSQRKSGRKRGRSSSYPSQARTRAKRNSPTKN